MTPANCQSGYNLQRPDDAIGYAAAAVAGLYRPWLLAAVIAGQAAMLLAFHATTSWHSAPDSALYMGLGRAIAGGEGYTFNGEFHTMVPPLFPLALAGVMRVFGSSFLALNLFQIALALACTPAIYLLTRQLFGRDLALLGAAAFALNFVQWTVASIVMSDLLFVLLATLGMSAAAWSAGNGPARWAALVLAGLGVAGASLTRSNGFVIVPGAAMAIWLGWRGRPTAARLAGAALLAAVALAPMIVWNRYAAAHVTGDPVTYLTTSHLGEPLGQMLLSMADNFFDKILTTASNLMVGFNDVPPGLNAVLPGLILIGCASSLRRREPMLPISLVCMVGVLLVVSGVKSRYFLFLYPGMAVLFLAGAVAVGRWAGRWRQKAPRQALRGALIFLAVAGGINVAHSIAQGVEYRKEEVAGGARLKHDRDWFTAARYLRAHHDRRQTGRDEPLALTSQSRLMFYIARIHDLGLTRGKEELSDQAYQEMTRRRRPEWLVGDAEKRCTLRAVRALEAIGVQLTPVTDAGLTGTVKIWRMSPPPPATSAPADPSSRAPLP
ncbi:MAG: glycosyltransferase family 39 protein [Planctomycetota bacterium]|nr:glycosyltransferase family 39 protein [Planctomycetota bacterium]